MIDFDSLVLGPCQDAFSRPVTITPSKSQPGQPAYSARGVFRSQAADVGLEDGALLNMQDYTLGLRRSELPVMVQQGDRIEIDSYQGLPRIGVCELDKINSDGQGDVQIVLKVVAP